MKFETRLKPCYNLIDLTPLVDVIFLMLIFFLITSDTLPLKSMLVQHPRIAHNEPAKLSQLVVIMDKDQVIYLGSKKEIVDLSSLEASLHRTVQLWKENHNGQAPTIVLSIDRRVEYQIFLQLLSHVLPTSPNIRLAFKSDEDVQIADEEAL